MKKLILRIRERILGRDYAIIPKADVRVFRADKVLTPDQIMTATDPKELMKMLTDLAVEDLKKAINPVIMIKEREVPSNQCRVYTAQIITIAPGANIR